MLEDCRHLRENPLSYEDIFLLFLMYFVQTRDSDSIVILATFSWRFDEEDNNNVVTAQIFSESGRNC